MSILLLFLLGVASSRHISYYDNANGEEPITGVTQERRICAELCMAGLGGEPCGHDCLDVIPQGLQSYNAQFAKNVRSGDRDYRRKDACEVLCANQLGYPLCGCNYTQPVTPFFKVNYFDVCSHFCTAYSYRLYGCAACDVYKNMTSDKMVALSGSATVKAYDWNEWCAAMCKEGDGGSACYCDLLPLSLKIK